MSAKQVSILGSTGSIGESTLDVIRHSSDFEIYGLSAYRNLSLLLSQCEEFNPAVAVLVDESLAEQFSKQLAQAECDSELRVGIDALDEIASNDGVDIVMAAIVGAAGLASSLAAVTNGKRLLLANKEALVMSGDLFMESAARSGAEIIPIDSEHNAVFQCLPANSASNGVSSEQLKYVSKIVLTASGGPFLHLPLTDFASITPEQACNHPNWEMGRKISVDSATMMNKGLELIEASHLFGLPAEQIEVLVHPQSIVHSLVYYRDGSVLAQMANPDMRVPIAHGLAHPQRIDTAAKPLELAELANLSFHAPDLERFPCLRMGIEAASSGGTAPTILNAANEIAVAAFLENRIKFSEISLIIEEVMSKIPCEAAASLAIIQDTDKHTRNLSNELISKEF
ncbi:MAG: 1-deoxy-D-xylulose-5-phosphate reductoisomerase [Gammaproteobacteria bacterium]|nr:1-deoxy-D-xylulose-5-phosphate reductoisomerase [Gammaproteobacteria bacterium]MDD9957762.1 1-deoxy-D-xylulose-5-phosphate reductoisomerase [Gammaproteobacteria bacterium]